MGIQWNRDKTFGDLGVLDLSVIPFAVKRIYWITNFVPGTIRGHHAHRTLRQAFLVLRGSVIFQISEGRKYFEVQLNEESDVLVIPPASWRTFSSNNQDSVLLVICDQTYEKSDYIRNWEEYLEWYDKKNGN